jgi:hypothetical protein
MKKIIYLTLSVFIFISCKNDDSLNSNYEANNMTFNKHVQTFKNHFLKGFETKNLDLMAEMYADSLKWNGPNEAGDDWGKKEISDVFGFYIDNFDKIELKDQLYFGGTVYAAQGKPSSDPNYIRVVGTWNSTHKATGVVTKTKWHTVMWFNEDGKVYKGSDWMDVSGIEKQIAREME